MRSLLLISSLLLGPIALAEVTPERLRDIRERAAVSKTAADRAVVEADYRSMVNEATEIAATHNPLQEGTVGIFVVRDWLHEGRLANAKLLAKFENGLLLMTVEGRRELHFDTEVRQAEVMPIIKIVRAGDRLGYAFLKIEIDGLDYRVVPDMQFETASVMLAGDVDYGRVPTDSELFVAIERPEGEPKIERVTAVYADDFIRVDQRLYDCSEGRNSSAAPRAHWLADQTLRSGWIEEKGELWEIATVGQLGGRFAYSDGLELKFVEGEVIRPIENSTLRGRSVVVDKPRHQKRVHTVAEHLPNGSIVTETREVVPPEHYRIDERGTAAEELARRGRFEKFFDAVSYVPKYLVYLTRKLIFRATARLHAADARIDATVLEGEERVLSTRKVPTSADKKDQKFGQRLEKGPVHDHLARNARSLALKFGAKTFILGPESDPLQAHVAMDGARIRVAYPPRASEILTGHETAHVRNAYHQVVLERLVPRTNGFLVTEGAGYEFFEKGFYSDYFTADEAHARTVEVGLALKAYERLAPSEDRTVAEELLRRAWHDLRNGRRFLKKMAEEIELLRYAVRADGGSLSTRQAKGFRIFRIIRPIVRQTAEDEPHRWAWMRVNGFIPPMNREQRVAFAFARLDDLEKDNARISRIFDHFEKRLQKLGEAPIEVVWLNCEKNLGTP